MKTSYSDLLLQILTIMGYKDKESYVAEFEEMNRLEAVMNCMDMLPESIQKQIKNKEIDASEVVKTLPKDLYMQELTNVSVQSLFDLFDQMKAVLSDKQKYEIINLICSY